MFGQIKAFWWNQHPNLGDALTPLLLEHFGFETLRAEPPDADVCVIGSVLQTLGAQFSGAIIGTGFISDGAAMPFLRARILALRGPLSAARAQAAPVAMGDAGLLCPMLLPGTQSPQVRLGIVPHYRDKQSRAVAAIADRLKEQVRIVDVQADPITVLREIAECEVVLSSSLHGLIAAEAFGRPTGWLLLSNGVIGAGFKFRDHYGALGAVAEPIVLKGDETEDQLERLATVKTFDLALMQRRLADCFQLLGK